MYTRNIESRTKRWLTLQIKSSLNKSSYDLHKAGTMATKHNHHGLFPKGWISQPRPDHVGWNSLGTLSFGVSTPKIMSMKVMEAIAMITAKSEMKPRTLAENRF